MDAVEKMKARIRRKCLKLRPAGSRIPRINKARPTSGGLEWEGKYHTEFCASGTAALSMALAVEIGPRGPTFRPEVILPAYGCPDLVAAVVAQNANPVLVDLIPDAPWMDLEQVEEAVSPATVAVVGVGLLGIPERLSQLHDLCQRKGIALIEDSAQCFPPAGLDESWADYVVLSFGRGKPINLMGGGALMIRRELVQKSIPIFNRFTPLKVNLGLTWHLKRLIFNLLLRRFPYFVLEKIPGLSIGETRFNRLDGELRVALPRELVLEGIQQFYTRPAVHGGYMDYIKRLESEGWKFLEGKPFQCGTARLPRNRFGVLAPTGEMRDRAVLELNRAGIGASGFYRKILPEIEGVPAMDGDADYPNARYFASRLLTLPCHEDVKPDDIVATMALIESLSREEHPPGS